MDFSGRLLKIASCIVLTCSGAYNAMQDDMVSSKARLMSLVTWKPSLEAAILVTSCSAQSFWAFEISYRGGKQASFESSIESTPKSSDSSCPQNGLL